MKIQHKRSAVAIGGQAKEPTAAQTERGELCINFSREDPALFIKDVDENIIRVGGDLSLYQKIEDVPSATIVCPPSEIDTLSPPDIRGEGSLWWNTEDGILYVWYEDADSSQWVITVPQGGGASGDVPPGTTVGDAPPLNPEVGQLWWNSDDTENGGGRLYVYYNDGDSAQWVDTSVPGGKGSYLNEGEAKGMFLSSTEDDTAAGQITFSSGITIEDSNDSNSYVRVRGNSNSLLYRLNGNINRLEYEIAGDSRTVQILPGQENYGVVSKFNRVGFLSQLVERPSGTYESINYYDTDVLSTLTGEIPDDTDISMFRAVWNPHPTNITFGSNVTVAGIRTKIDLSPGATIYNILTEGSAPSRFNSYIDVATRDGNPRDVGGIRLNTTGLHYAGLISDVNGEPNFTLLRENTTTGIENTNARFITFRNAAGTRGVIAYNSAGGIDYAETSDYRLKENIVDMPSAVDVVKQLRPVSYNYISCPGKTVSGFLAHEVQDAIPFSVTGEKDAVEEYGDLTNADGSVEKDVAKPEAVPFGATFESKGVRDDVQLLDKSRLIPYLTKALQEVIAKNEDLEARLAALEGA